MDKYIREYLKAIKDAKTDDDRVTLLNKVYEDGFADGCNEGTGKTVK